MNRTWFKKLLTVAVLLLFISVSVIPSTGTTDVKQITVSTTSGDTLYVGGSGPGNFTSIQDAIDHAYDGDTIFVYNGTYREHLTIKKKINLIGENRETTIIQGKNEDADLVYVEANKVNISGFTIQHSTYLNGGIYVSDSYGNTISNCDLCHIPSMDAICLMRSSNNHILNCSISDGIGDICVAYSQSNFISNCSLTGSKSDIDIIGSSNNVISNCSLKGGVIYLGDSSDNSISNCHVFNPTKESSFGFQIGYSTNTTLRNNTLEHCGIIFHVNFPYHYYHDIDYSNVIDGKPIYYLVEESNREFNETMDIGYIGLISCTNITVKNLSLHGAVLGNTSFTTIKNCSFYENSLGVDIGLSTNNVVSNCNFSTYRSVRIRKSTNNIVSDCRMPIGSKYGAGVDINYYSSKNIISNCLIANFSIGVIIGGASPSNIVSGCIISDCKVFGIWILTSDNIIMNNTIEHTTGSAIDISGGSTNNISYNTIQSNSQGISVDGGSHNEIFCNNIKSNTNGIYLLESLNNKIIRNNFMKNKEKDAQFAAEKLSNCKNIWSDNYWNRPRFLPKLIFGRIGIYYLAPWINVDWHPAQEPYDIGV